MSMKMAEANSAVLIAEYNHRISNTYQIILSEVSKLDRLDCHKSRRNGLHGLNDRLLALAEMHRLLGAHGDYFMLEEHCRRLCDLLLRAFGRCDVAAHLEIADADFTRDQAAKISLMVVELVTNALKHSLSASQGGTIWIDLRRSGRRVELAVSDSLRMAVPSQQVPRILSLLAESLGGKAFVEDRDGFTAGASFPYAPPLGAPPPKRRRSGWSGWSGWSLEGARAFHPWSGLADC